MKTTTRYDSKGRLEVRDTLTGEWLATFQKFGSNSWVLWACNPKIDAQVLGAFPFKDGNEVEKVLEAV